MKPKIKVADLAKALQGIETDRQLTKEIVEDALKEALTKAYRKHIEIPDAYVRVDVEDGTIHIYHERMVVEEVEDDELEWITNQGTPLLRVSVEKEDGTIDLDTCATCSDAIGTMLDEKDWYAKEYMLEVCSPGAERELRTDEEIQRAVGKYVFVKMKDPKQGLDQVIGDLIEATENDVTISYRDKTRTKKITIEKSNIQLIMTAVKV